MTGHPFSFSSSMRVKIGGEEWLFAWLVGPGTVNLLGIIGVRRINGDVSDFPFYMYLASRVL